MARIANIEKGIVSKIIVAETEWVKSNLKGFWINVTNMKVGVGYTYTYENEEFRPPKPYPSWYWNGQRWNAPQNHPKDDRNYSWNEENQQWELE